MDALKKLANYVRRSSGTRILIELDSEGVYFRKTLCVTHDLSAGEVIYVSEPVCGGLTIDAVIENGMRLLLESNEAE